jgi:hypothetical protein
VISEWRAQEAREGAGSIEQVADAQVLVEAVLVIVVVDQRDDNERNFERIHERLGRNGATHHADANNLCWNPVLRESLCQRGLRPRADLGIERREGSVAAAQESERSDLVVFSTLPRH